ncbi:uncharacterized protein SPPG_08978 [Spizellomyces punctatus DAOM BR117]|uniref:Phospholipase A-2-activating protein n=1 Tax=Spizellomyces punctatus (strain DAOM BR117) TaxID=645134 RepID=A0A0L0HPT2_SPIPD|nr:uncharacterized protein SPPG_08978 [Spizellomyces punctatus DAOM BR117]KND02975.1 hypothetical protein SPPG_08978 [Spizellomyces punctatus DAOM BR117]|eukprot:XP_016611014.1 hypothetical protein SPPG_08978 [Spizellomyces punctatus DAOM BR117]
MTFQLSAVLVGHESDVKAVVAATEDLLASVSRDTSTITWRRTGANSFEPSGRFQEHSHFVNAVTYLPPSGDHPNGLFASAGSDKIIAVFDPTLPKNALYSLIGHTDNVCALSTAPNGDIISGSWDFTAKVWRNWECIFTVKHNQSVWAVLGLEDGGFLTGSADKTIKLWRDGKCVHTYLGHTDAVRGLAPLSDRRFVSCSNDGTLRIWSLDGECLQELTGHTSFVYTVAILPSGEIVSGGEDRSIRIWKGGECVQTIIHPCPSVWSVASLANGDIITGASDAVVRVFTKSNDRLAPPEVLKAFDDSVASQAIPSNQIGDVDKSKLPGPDVLDRPGNKDQQVIMVNMGNSVEAHQWSQADHKWHKVGEVVDAIGSGRKTQFEGRDYDYVFDVDIGEGMPPLKLPYNASQNPYEAAQEFIWKHELPQDYLDQIANFILQNAKDATLGASSSSYQDPFTGGNRYVPGGSRGPASEGSAYQSAGVQLNRAPQSSSYIPHLEYTLFKAANLTAILAKLVQLNADLEKSMDYGTAALKPEEEKDLEQVIKSLETPSKSQQAFKPHHLAILQKAALQWPPQQRFPAIDILRLVVLHSSLPVTSGSLARLLDQLAGFSTLKQDALSKVEETNIMLALRFLANAFATKEGQASAYNERQQIVDLVKDCWRGTQNKNLRVALATVFLNYAVLLNERPDDALRVDLLKTVIEFLRTETDAETEFRAMVALGTLVHDNADAKEAANLMNAASTVKRARRTTGDSEVKLQQIEKDLIALLR